MGEQKEFHFFYSKLHLFHLAVNIGLAPALFYVLRLWSWPPQLDHMVVFAISFMVAIFFVRRRMNTPKLSVTNAGVTFGKFYPTEIIFQARPEIRSVTLTMYSNKQVTQRIIHLGWASKEDREVIQKLLAERFQRDLPKEAFGE